MSDIIGQLTFSLLTTSGNILKHKVTKRYHLLYEPSLLCHCVHLSYSGSTFVLQLDIFRIFRNQEKAYKLFYMLNTV